MSKRNDLIARAAIETVHAAAYYRHIGDTRKAERLLDRLLVALPYTDATMHPTLRSIIMHALGADDRYPRRGGHRNYYAPPSPGTVVHDLLIEGVDAGWLEWGAPYRDTRYVHVTEAGARAAGQSAWFAWRQHKGGA